MNFNDEIKNILKYAGVENNISDNIFESTLKENTYDDEDDEISDDIREIIYQIHETESSDYDDSDIKQLYELCNFSSYSYNSLEGKLSDICTDFYSDLAHKAYDNDDYQVTKKFAPYDGDRYFDAISDNAYDAYYNNPIHTFETYSHYNIADFIKKIKEYCEQCFEEKYNIKDDEVSQETDEFDPESIDTLDEAFNLENVDDDIKKIYEYVSMDHNDLSDDDFRELLSLCENCGYKEIEELKQDTFDSMIDGFMDDSDNWIEEIDPEATLDACYEAGLDELVGNYAYSYEKEEFVNNIKNTISQYYNIDDYDKTKDKIYNLWKTGDYFDNEIIKKLIDAGFEEDESINIVNAWNKKKKNNQIYKVGDKVKFKDAQDIFTIKSIDNFNVLISNDENPSLIFNKERFEREFELVDNYEGDDTEIDESVQELKENYNDLDDTDKKIIDCIKECEDNDYLDDYIIDLYNLCNDYGGRLNNIAEDFYRLLVERAEDDEANAQYKKLGPNDTTDNGDSVFEILWERSLEYLYDNPRAAFREYGSTTLDELFAEVLRLCEEYYAENYGDLENSEDTEIITPEEPVNKPKGFDPESIDTLDETFNPENVDDNDIIEIYDIVSDLPSNVTSSQLEKLFSLGTNCNDNNIQDYIQKVTDEIRDDYIEDSDNWINEVDFDETSEYCWGLGIDNLVYNYGYTNDKKEFVADVRNEFDDDDFNDIDEDEDEDENYYDGEDSEIDEAENNKKESSFEKILRLHKEHPTTDIRDIANKVADGNIEEYIGLMKQYYEKFEN